MNINKSDLISILNGNQEIIQKYRSMVVPNKKCKRCGKSFIPRNRTDELYCEYCHSLCCDMKLSAEMKDYRREYKRMHAKMVRGKVSRKQFDEHMKQYRKEKKHE